MACVGVFYIDPSYDLICYLSWTGGSKSLESSILVQEASERSSSRSIPTYVFYQSVILVEEQLPSLKQRIGGRELSLSS